jgi:hypothetical protein
VCREAPRAVPAAVVEELPSARAQEREDVLEVRGRSSLRHQASPDRAGLGARRGAGGPRDRCRSRSDASGCLGAASGRPRGGGPALGGAPRAATRWRRPPRRPSPRAARRSRLPFLADVRAARSSRPSSAKTNARAWRVEQRWRDAWRKSADALWSRRRRILGALRRRSQGQSRPSSSTRRRTSWKETAGRRAITCWHPERMGSRGSPERDGGGCPTHAERMASRDGAAGGTDGALAASARSCRAVAIQRAAQRRWRPAAAPTLGGIAWLGMQRRRPPRPPTRP